MVVPTVSDAELDALARQVDDQLTALHTSSASFHRGPAPTQRSTFPDAPEHERYLAQVSGQPFETFWYKYLRHARRDLCKPDGLLYQHWQRWRDLPSKDAVRLSLAFLAGIGVTSTVLTTAAVAAAVCLLNVILKVGVDAICEGCTGEAGA